MKSGKIVYGILGIFIFLYSCTTTNVFLTNPNGKVPPGQMKKTTGSQSAKPYAPGQQKKTGGSPSNNSNSPGQKKKK